VLFAPGSWFSPGNGARHLRLCYGAVADDAIEPGVEILARAAKAVRARARRPRGDAEAALPSV
jgi:DNA-binding transcriptional MocR family regulator